MKKYVVFSMFVLLGFHLNSFCMEKKNLIEKTDKTEKPLRGYVVRRDLLQTYNLIGQNEKKECLKILEKIEKKEKNGLIDLEDREKKKISLKILEKIEEKKKEALAILAENVGNIAFTFAKAKHVTSLQGLYFAV